MAIFLADVTSHFPDPPPPRHTSSQMSDPPPVRDVIYGRPLSESPGVYKLTTGSGGGWISKIFTNLI